ncbi:hypothetical protein [Parvularcula lutaonensis]|uniref:DUF202 domain-containing protein n=1 Tax=Parvularcula lutaonensis TaxID=491923 RepID=A0ABV7MCX5_9PROT|nr:hypothetical protein [Parvularcula lutaonensis]GGY39832.1 hypothetical protein GCM10007148_05350 [Parvularcula lutaonensis]
MTFSEAAKYYLADLGTIVRQSLMAAGLFYVGLLILGTAVRLLRSGKFSPEIFSSLLPFTALVFFGTLAFALIGSYLVRSRFRREHYSRATDAKTLNAAFEKKYRKKR